MDTSHRKKPQIQSLCPSPAPNLPSSSSLFKDISNFKTPKRPSRTFHSQLTTPQFFTATKQTPSSAFTAAGSYKRRPSMALTTAASTKSKASRRLKVLELEQSRSCRRELVKKEKSLKSLAGSLTAWLNFLFENPNQCGCGGNEVGLVVDARFRVGKRDSLVRRREEDGIRVDCMNRWPKRQREGSWSEIGNGDWSDELEISSSKFPNLQKSLSDLFSFDDLKGRMREYLSLSTCKEIFNIMTRVTKNIDEGRLKMRSHCPLVTDLGLKEKAIKALLSYNSVWLRVGLYMVFGGESLLIDGGSATDEEIAFLKVVIEKQLFSHGGLAKSFAYNKRVEGLYKPGYFEMLGNVILKRFLLLVLILDRAKSQSSLPIKYGLDGLDGGSPLLFNAQSNIKSSQQMITDFLITEVMHGEGNLIAHLVMIGFRVSYEQLPLIEYNFRIEDLFPDIQDGVKLCRAIQLLENDSSILTKLALPADSCKKRLANCNIALQYLKKAGVPLCDDDGMLITGDDIINGDKELTLSLLWNVFVHLQIPLLINKSTLYDEICKICKANYELKDVDSSSHLDMVLDWIKAICKNYDDKEERLNSVVDGKAMWCLLDFYFHEELTCSCSPKDMGETGAEESIISSVDSSDAVHNFVLSQRITTLLGNVPQVLQTSDILEYNGPCNNRSVIVLLVFLSTQLLVKKSKDQLNFHKLMGCCCLPLERRRSSLDRLSKKTEAKLIKDEDSQETIADAARKFKAVKAWWQEMTKQDKECIIKPVPAFSLHLPASKRGSNVSREKAVIVIQSHVRKMNKRHIFLKTRNAVSCLQMYVRAWLSVKQRIGYANYRTIRFKESQKKTENLARTIDFMVDRHNFVKLKRSALLIQSAARLMLLRNQRAASLTMKSASHVLESCLMQMNGQEEDSTLTCDRKTEDDFIKTRLNSELDEKVFVVCQGQQTEEDSTITCDRKTEDDFIKTRLNSELDEKEFVVCQGQQMEEDSTLTCDRKTEDDFIKTRLNSELGEKEFVVCQGQQMEEDSILTCDGKTEDDCIKMGLNSVLDEKEFVVPWCQQMEESAASVIQRHYRGWMARKHLESDCIKTGLNILLDRKGFVVCQSQQMEESAATVIQRYCRGWLAREHLENQQQAIITIQRVLRCLRLWRTFNNEKVATRSAIIIQSYLRGWLVRRDASRRKHCIVVIQSNIRCWLARRVFLSQKSAAIEIQSCLRALICSKAFSAYVQAAIEKEESAAIVIQRYCRGWLAREHLENQQQAIITIQRVLRCMSLWRTFNNEKVATRSAIIIQSYLRGWLVRRDASKHKHCIVVIQSNIRCWLARRVFLSQKSAAIVIQSSLRAQICSKAFSACVQAAIEIQRFARGRITRTRLLGASRMQSVHTRDITVANSRNQFQSAELKMVVRAIVKLQRWWRRTVTLKSRVEATVVIQSHFRGWIARRRAAREKRLIIYIQSNWKGYIARRDAKEQLVDLRYRVQKSAANVDDGMRLINRHIAALNELLSMKSLSNILRNCATLDKATGLSNNCCEILVEAGAIDILLKQIKSVSRSIPDQEILKHSLSILRNLARYPHLADTLVNHRGTVETVLWEMLRNKEEAYFIACDLLKKICLRRKGFEAMLRLPSLLKRLCALVDELNRKAINEKRMNNKQRAATGRDGTERRLKEAVEILNMITQKGDHWDAWNP